MLIVNTEAIMCQPLHLHSPLQKQLDTIFVISIVPNNTYDPDVVRLIKLCIYYKFYIVAISHK